MKLSIDSLNKTKASLESLDNFKSVLTAEAFAEISEESLSIKKSVNDLCSIISDLNTAGESLARQGFSDEWFAIVNDGDRFVKLLDIDMPKFFKDNNAKKEACQEAIADGIKRFLMALWQIVCKAFEWLWKVISQVLQYIKEYLGKMDDRAATEFEKRFKDALDKLGSGFGLIYNGPDPKKLTTYCKWYAKLGDVIWNDDEWNDTLLDSVNPQDDIRPYFYGKLAHICAKNQVPSNDIEMYGWAINKENNGVVFIDLNNIAKIEATYTTKAEVATLLANFKGARDAIKQAGNQLNVQVKYAKGTFDDLKREANTDLAQGAVSTRVCEYKQTVEQVRLSGIVCRNIAMLVACINGAMQTLNANLLKMEAANIP